MFSDPLRHFLYACLTSFLSLVVCVFFVEFFLRWHRPEYSYQAKALRNFDSHRLLLRPSYGMSTYPHPDREEWVSVRYDGHGLRTLSSPSPYTFSKAWGFFGDSYVENLRIQEDELFTTHLAQKLQAKKTGVFNFGVEGYGPDQSYLTYLDFPFRDRLQKVFYIFCHNDLVNLSQNQIFSLQDQTLVSQLKSELPLWKKMLGQLYLTYFFLESYHQLHGLETKKFFRSSSEHVDTPWLGDAPLQRRYQRRKQKQHKVGLKELKVFKFILKNWRAEVKKRGGEFEVIVLPDRLSHEMALNFKSLSKSWHFTRDYFLEEFEGQHKWTFQNDDHWNELAQKRFASFLLEKFKP